MATEKPRDAIEIFKDTVLVAAADAVIKEMTPPEAMKALVEKSWRSRCRHCGPTSTAPSRR